MSILEPPSPRLRPHRLRGGALAVCASALLLLLLSGCASDNPGITPDVASFYFPTGIALDAKRGLLYVTNSNADLRFNGGSLMALSLTSLPDDLSNIGDAVAKGTLGCERDRIDPSRWECDEEAFVLGNTTVRTGDFPGDVRLNHDGTRLFVPVRGTTQLIWADVVNVGQSQAWLRCNEDGRPSCAADRTDCPIIDCDSAHTVTFSDRLQDTLPSEPFGVVYHRLTAVHFDAQGKRHTCGDGVSSVPCDCGTTAACSDGLARVSCCVAAPSGDHVYLAHLLGGEVSLLRSSSAGVELLDFAGGFFNSTSGIRGAFALAPSLPGDATSPVYVSSRVDNAIATFVIADDTRVVRVRRLGIGAITPGDDIRGIAVRPGGDVIYAIDRRPSALVAIRVRDELGQDIAEPLWATEVCKEPAVLSLQPDPARASVLLAYVVCFNDKLIYILDTETGAVVGRILTGDGPNALQFDPARKRAYVANFAEKTIGVIDLDPSHDAYRRMVLRIGRVEKVDD